MTIALDTFESASDRHIVGVQPWLLASCLFLEKSHSWRKDSWKNHPIYWSRWRFTNSHAGPEAAAMSAPRFLFHPKGYWVQEGDPRDEQQCSQAIHSFVLTGGVNTGEFINKEYLKTLPPKHLIWCCRCKTKVCVFNIYILTCWRTSQCET